MKKVLFSLILLSGFFTVMAQDQLTNTGNFYIHPGSSVTAFGNFDHLGALTLGTGATLSNNGTFTYRGNISNAGTFAYGDTATLVYANPTILQTTGTELPPSDMPETVVVNNPFGVVLSDNTVVTNLTLSNGKLNIGSHTLTLGGVFTGSATNSLTLNGLSNITTIGSTGTLFFDQSSNSSRLVNNFVLQSGSVTMGNRLAVAGIVTHTAGTLNSGGNLALVAADSVTYGQVAGTGSGTISGTMSMEMMIPGTNEGWRTFCSPLENVMLSDLGTQTEINLTNSAPSGDNRNVYQWVEATKTWGLVTADELMNGKAYNIYLFDLANDTFELSGTYTKASQNAGTLTYTNSGTSDQDGWHLMNNPYPSGLNWNSFSLPTGMNNQYAIWSVNDGNYRPWNGTVGLAGQYIPPMHAYWVKVTATTSTDFIISSSNRITNTQNHFGKKGSLTNGVTLDVHAVSGSYKDQLIVYFNEAKLPEDNEGAEKLMGNENAPQLWTVNGGKKYSIDVYGPDVNKNTVVPVGFKTKISGTYTIEPGLENMVSGMEAWLEDTKTNQWHDLSTGAYTFVYQSTETVPTRFNLHFKPRVTGTETQETPEEQIIVFSKDGAIVVKIPGTEDKGDVSITVWNMLGQSVYQQMYHGGNEFTLYPNTTLQGMYLVEVKTANSSRTIRILR